MREYASAYRAKQHQASRVAGFARQRLFLSLRLGKAYN
jgi:hypothetical protein